MGNQEDVEYIVFLRGDKYRGWNVSLSRKVENGVWRTKR
jgi:hypothetical protein